MMLKQLKAKDKWLRRWFKHATTLRLMFAFEPPGKQI